MIANTTFPTTNASRYLGTLCKHFGHKMPARFDAHEGEIDFPFGRCLMNADDSALRISATASDQAELDRLTGVIGSHLERFAFREAPTIVWTRDAAA